MMLAAERVPMIGGPAFGCYTRMRCSRREPVLFDRRGDAVLLTAVRESDSGPQGRSSGRRAAGRPRFGAWSMCDNRGVSTGWLDEVWTHP